MELIRDRAQKNDCGAISLGNARQLGSGSSVLYSALCCLQVSSMVCLKAELWRVCWLVFVCVCVCGGFFFPDKVHVKF